MRYTILSRTDFGRSSEGNSKLWRKFWSGGEVKRRAEYGRTLNLRDPGRFRRLPCPAPFFFVRSVATVANLFSVRAVPLAIAAIQEERAMRPRLQ